MKFKAGGVSPVEMILSDGILATEEAVACLRGRQTLI